MTRLHLPARAGLAGALALGTLMAATARDARAQAMIGANPWSLGMDATLSSSRASLAGEQSPRETDFTLPVNRARLGYRVSPGLQLEVPFSLGAFSSEQSKAQFATVGLDANLYFAPGTTTRPFVGVGTSFDYLRLKSDFLLDDVLDNQTRTRTQLGASARLGFDWQALPSLSFRPTLFYQHQFEKAKDELPAVNAFGATFGATMHFGPQPRAASSGPSPVQISIGGELGRTTFGRIEEGAFSVTPDAITTFQAPRALVGVFVPVAAGGRAMLGANVSLSHGSGDGISQTNLGLQPRLELNVNPGFRTARSVRLGVHGNYEHSRGSFDGESDSNSRLGAGADLSLTFPAGPSMLSRIGVGYDFLGGKERDFQPSQKRISLKFGFDAL